MGVVRWLTTTPRHRGVVGAEGQLWAAAMQMGRAATAEANKSRQHGVQRQVPKAGIESQHAAAAFSHSTLQNHTTVFVRPVLMFESLTHKWAVAVFFISFLFVQFFLWPGLRVYSLVLDPTPPRARNTPLLLLLRRLLSLFPSIILLQTEWWGREACV